MNIKIIRGQNQIGGSIIEISSQSSKIIFDLGINLMEDHLIKVPKIEGLFEGSPTYKAVFISHYHLDHLGLLGHLQKDIPIYMGEKGYNVIYTASKYLCKLISYLPIFIKHQIPITIDDFMITPFLCDHSAFDSYMYLIENAGKKVLYTGDFRANGRKDFSLLLQQLPFVDAIIIEGTTLSREEGIRNIEETKLEEIASKRLKENTGPAFIMMSSQNIDRLVTIYNASVKNNRVFLEDLYTASISRAVGEESPSTEFHKDIRVFPTNNSEMRYCILKSFGDAKIGRYEISRLSYTMCVRPSMKEYLEKLNQKQSFENGILFYAMWSGYQENKDVKEFLDFMRNRGVKLHMLHTSGHADEETIDALIAQVNPKTIIPIHTQNANWFKKFDKCNVELEKSEVII